MNNLNSEQKSQIYSLLERFSTVFAKDKYDIGTVKEAIKSKNALKKRNEVRNPWVTLTDTLSKDYKDESGNIFFNNEILEDITTMKQSEETSTRNDNLVEILQKLTDKSDNKNLKRVAEKFTLDKFSGKNNNAIQWLEIFENECDRFDIEEDKDKIEILRIFLDNAAADWYGSKLLKYTLDSEWKTWKENFKTTFVDKGWESIRFAFTYRYMKGSLLDYALKKEKILLETNKNVEATTLINLIAIGLPNFITDRIDKEKLKVTEDLFNELRRLEHLSKKNENKKDIFRAKVAGKTEKKPCILCEKANRGVRYHPETQCWFNSKENTKSNNLKSVNTGELDIHEEFTDPKN